MFQKEWGAYAAISMYMHRRISSLFRPKKVELIYNPIKEMFFDLGYERIQREVLVSNDKLKLLYVGGLTKLKGIDKLLMFFSSILREFHNVELHIVDDGPLREYLVYLVHKLNLKNKVFIHGHVDDNLAR
jgi:glycosyltransferase involved in cell wall biosynthesis